jgi:uncharacterized protein YbcI
VCFASHPELFDRLRVARMHLASSGLTATLPFEPFPQRGALEHLEVAMDGASMNGRVPGAGLSHISTELVRLYSRYCGKGPTRAKTHVAGDLVVCVLRDAFTRQEQTLIDGGEFATVERMRDGFRRLMDVESRRAVEEACGRPVRAHLNTLHADPDMAVEIFLLEPRDDEHSVLDAALAGSNGHRQP